jgi:cell division protein FtsB
MQQTEKYWNMIYRILLIAIIVMAGVGVVLAFAPKVKQLRDDQETYNALQKRIETTEALENELKEKQRRFTTDPEFVARVAHEVGYARDDETIFVLPAETSGN